MTNHLFAFASPAGSVVGGEVWLRVTSTHLLCYLIFVIYVIFVIFVIFFTFFIFALIIFTVNIIIIIIINTIIVIIIIGSTIVIIIIIITIIVIIIIGSTCSSALLSASRWCDSLHPTPLLLNINVIRMYLYYIIFFCKFRLI